MALSPRSGALLQGDDVLEAYRLNSALRKSARPTSREEWAKALLQQGSAGTPVGSPLEGLAKMLTAGVGGYIGGEERRAGEQTEAQMLADMMGRKSQQQAEEQRQLAGAGVPGFNQPPAPVEPGVARAVPTAMGGVEAVPQGFDAPPTRAPANVDAALIQAVAAMQAGGNKTAGSALPGLQFAYGDIRDREREAKADAREAARDARAAASASREPEQLRILRALGIDPTSPQARELLFPKSVPGGPPSPFPDKTVAGAAANILANPDSDINSLAYAIAFNEKYGEKRESRPDGSEVVYIPSVPQGVRRPGAAAMAAAAQQGGAATPVPAVGTTAEPTPTARPPVRTDLPGGGSVTRTQGQTLSPAEVKLKEEAETQINSLTTTRKLLEEAKTLSKDAYYGPLATTRGSIAGVTGRDEKGAVATRRFENIMTSQALERLKEIFGGNPTEGERKILLSIQASAGMSRPEREALIDDAMNLIAQREAIAKKRLGDVTGGGYGRVGTPAGPRTIQYDAQGNRIP